MFALLGLSGMEKLGKVMNRDSQIQEDDGGSTDTERFKAKTQKAYSQNIDAVRKRGYSANVIISKNNKRFSGIGPFKSKN